jgi:hypothetical protein
MRRRRRFQHVPFDERESPVLAEGLAQEPHVGGSRSIGDDVPGTLQQGFPVRVQPAHLDDDVLVGERPVRMVSARPRR